MTARRNFARVCAARSSILKPVYHDCSHYIDASRTTNKIGPLTVDVRFCELLLGTAKDIMTLESDEKVLQEARRTSLRLPNLDRAQAESRCRLLELRVETTKKILRMVEASWLEQELRPALEKQGYLTLHCSRQQVHPLLHPNGHSVKTRQRHRSLKTIPTRY